MATILNITDGTTTVNCIWHSVTNRKYNFPPAVWAPMVAPRRRSKLGGRPPYEDVIEEIEIDVLGATAAEVITNYQTVVNLIDQAVAWSDGERVNPVRIEHQPNGSALSSALQALVLGRANGDETSGVRLPVTIHKDLNCYCIRGMKICVWRRGQWLGASESSTTAATAANSTLQSVTFPSSASVLSPTTLSLLLSGLAASSATTFSGVLLYAASTSDLIILESNSFNGTGYLSVAEGSNARAGNVTRYTPTTTNPSTTNAVALTGLSSSASLIGVYAVVRNNSATTSFQLRANATLSTLAGSGTPPTASTNYKQIDTSSTAPQVVNLGTLASPGGFAALSLTTVASAASGTFDIDYIVVLALDLPTSGAISLQNALISTGAGNTTATISVKDRSLTHKTPAVTVTVGSSETPLTYTDDAYVLTKGTGLVAVLLSPAGTNWRMSGASPINVQLSATRRPAYLIPY